MKLLNNYKKKRLKEKELIEKIKNEEKEIEKEINEHTPEAKFTFNETINLLKGKDEEELEYESYLTEDELKEENRKKEEERKIAKRVGIILIGVIIITVIGSKVFYDTFKSDLLKVTEPLLKEHYEKITGEKAKTKTIQELMRIDENRKEVKTGIYLLTTKDNKHLMSLNNSLIGDDININTKKSDAKNYVINKLGDIELITDSISLSYDDYYITYNRFLDYMNVLPSDMSFEDLLESGKLALTYKAIYQGTLDLENIKNMMIKLSPNSSVLLLKQDNTGVKNVTYIKKDMVFTADITAEIEKDDGVAYLELDRNINGVNDVTISLYANSSVSTKNDYNIINPISIEPEEESYRRDEVKKPTFYLIRVSSSLINDSGFVELSTSKREDTYTEIEKEEYEDVQLLTIGSYTYIFGEEDLFIGQVSGKKTFLCKLGIC